MKVCDCCTRARLSPRYPLFCPTCLHCGARLIQAVGFLPVSRQEVSSRRRQVLIDWIAHGHHEQAIRTLAAMDTPALAPLEPIGPAPNTASAAPSPKKRR